MLLASSGLCGKGPWRGGRRRPAVMKAAATDTVVSQDMLEVAQRAADAAAAVTCPLFRAKIKIDIKDDSSPVTQADKDAELAMRKLVEECLPTHAVFGEEFGFAPGSGDCLPLRLP